MEIKLGDKFSTERLVTDELIRKFADVSGDYNPIHLDEDVASKNALRTADRARHAERGIYLRGPWLRVQRAQHRLSFTDSEVHRSGFHRRHRDGQPRTVTNIREDKPIITLETICTNQNGDVLVKGEAAVMILGRIWYTYGLSWF
jgi:hypothetical protein